MGGSLSSAAQHAGALVSATGAFMASMGTGTCAIRRGRNLRPEDRADVENAVDAMAANRAETATAIPVVVKTEREEVDGDVTPTPKDPPDDDVVPVLDTRSTAPAGELIPIMVATSNSTPSSAPSSSVASFCSARSSLSSTTSISGLFASKLTQHLAVGSALGDDSSLSGSSDTLD